MDQSANFGNRVSAPDSPFGDDVERLRWENFELRSLLARCHAELMETKMAASRDRKALPLDAEAAVRTLGSQLTAAAEALAQANAACQDAAKQAQELGRALAERNEAIRRKDLLNREIDHRIKNSLQDIISLLRIQAHREKNARVLAFANVACARLEALAAAHELLHASASPDQLDFSAYLERLCGCLIRAMGIDGEHRTLILEAEPVTLRCEAAQALALVVNELVTNAFRHAFPPGEPGTVWVQLSCRNGKAVLTVADDGRGLPKHVTLGDGQGLGFQLVTLMAGQVGAQMTVTTKGGVRFTLSIPLSRELGPTLPV
ncbi:sensor histidine kinase [Azospirillum canadense]|uniref:sensor histidine kinase n=1 Tax=Azospirillum canadense TaxID=403962 RepID=UPI002227D3AE|nr:sensor histidine kinase [Azospirillum canadense]MCW2239131.1 two-component sensor histidine kinase [Azospirillum canadense]